MDTSKLKGNTTIKLFDENGKLKESFQDDNLITDAYEQIVSAVTKNYHIGGMVQISDMTAIVDNLSPSDLFGSVVLLDTVQSESPTQVIVKNANVVAHASDEPYTGSLMSRGNFLVDSSGEILNGYEWVWEWGLSRGIGTIRSVCQCARTLGRGGKLPYVGAEDMGGSLHINLPQMIEMPFLAQRSEPSFTVMDALRCGQFSNGGYLTQLGTSGTIVWKKYERANLYKPQWDTSSLDVDPVEVSISLDTDELFKSYVINNVLYGFRYKPSTLKWYLETYSDIGGPTLTPVTSLELGTSAITVSDVNAWAVCGSYLYILDDVNQMVQKFDMTTGGLSDSIPILTPGKHYLFPLAYDQFFLSCTDGAVAKAYVFTDGDISFGFPTGYSLSGTFEDIGNVTSDGLILYSDSYYTVPWVGGFHETHYFLHPYIISTINNLASPIIKDNSTAMQLTYTLTW